jgi:N-carbamoylputrescine amidase
MFNEHARAYGRAGADLIVIPRAAGTSHTRWLAAGAMAAVVSGSYVVSSNRVGNASCGITFGGVGFVFGPDGELIAKTSAQQPVMSFELDLERSRAAKSQYPRYVKELPQ